MILCHVRPPVTYIPLNEYCNVKKKKKKKNNNNKKKKKKMIYFFFLYTQLHFRRLSYRTNIQVGNTEQFAFFDPSASVWDSKCRFGQSDLSSANCTVENEFSVCQSCPTPHAHIEIEPLPSCVITYSKTGVFRGNTLFLPNMHFC